MIFRLSYFLSFKISTICHFHLKFLIILLFRLNIGHLFGNLFAFLCLSFLVLQFLLFCNSSSKRHFRRIRLRLRRWLLWQFFNDFLCPNNTLIRDHLVVKHKRDMLRDLNLYWNIITGYNLRINVSSVILNRKIHCKNSS